MICADSEIEPQLSTKTGQCEQRRTRRILLQVPVFLLLLLARMPGVTSDTRLIYRLTMKRMVQQTAAQSCQKWGGRLAAMDEPFADHLTQVMGRLLGQGKLEPQHKLWVDFKWVPSKGNWTWSHDGSLIPRDLVRKWDLPEGSVDELCACVRPVMSVWSVAPFKCTEEHRTVCQYYKGDCSYTSCPGNAVLDSGVGTEKELTQADCHQDCNGRLRDEPACVGYSNHRSANRCRLHLSSTRPMWDSTHLMAHADWDTKLARCLGIIQEVPGTPITEEVILPNQDPSPCVQPLDSSIVPVTDLNKLKEEESTSQYVLHTVPGPSESDEEITLPQSQGTRTTDYMIAHPHRDNTTAVSPPLVDVTTIAQEPNSATPLAPTDQPEEPQTDIPSTSRLQTSSTVADLSYNTEENEASVYVTPHSSFPPPFITTSGHSVRDRGTTTGHLNYRTTQDSGDALARVTQSHQNFSDEATLSSPCPCPCGWGDHFTEAEKREWLARILTNLTIDVKKTGQYIRQLISVDDPRPSARGCGYVAIAVMSAVLGLLVLMDSATMVASLGHCWKS